MSDAIIQNESVPGPTEVLWIADNLSNGWKHRTSYRFQILHSPEEQKIQLKIWEEGTLIIESGEFFDNSSDSLQGGRLGVYCNSQEMIIWSALSYRCL